MKISVDEASSIYNRAARLAWPKAPKSARDIIAQWYANEGAAEDFGSAKDLAEFMKDDIANMVDAATDPNEIEIVCAATGCEAPSGDEAPKYVGEPDEQDAADAIIEYLGKSFERIDPVGSNKLKLTIAGDAAKKMAKMKEIATQYGCTVKLLDDGAVVVSKPENEGFRLELVDTIKVPQWLYDAYLMGNDYSGDLTDDEKELLASFKERYAKYHLDNHDEEAQYCGTNDFDGMGGLCYEVDVYEHSSDEKCEGQEVDLSTYLDDVANSLEWDFEYSPVTAFEFAHDDYKDIAIACFEENQSPKEAAAAIDSKFTDGNEAKGETMDFEKYYKEFEKEAKKLLSAELWDKACAGNDPKGFAKDLFDAEFEPGSAAEEFAEMVETMDGEGAFGEAKCEGEHECEWCVEYEDVWDNKECEKFPTEPEAWARYNELLARTHGDMADIVWVEEPKCPTCECGSSAASLGAVPTGGSQVKDEEIPENKETKGEGAEDFLSNALDNATVEDPNSGESYTLKFVADAGEFELIALLPNGERVTLKTGPLFAVTDYYRELVEMDPEDAVVLIENA